MIPEAREVRLSRSDRKELEALCRSPRTMQQDLKRARIVLPAAEGRSTRSIANDPGSRSVSANMTAKPSFSVELPLWAGADSRGRALMTPVAAAIPLVTLRRSMLARSSCL
jgi:hypothetical protein